MSYTRHEAIRELYSNVVTVSDSAGAFDKDGKSVVIDDSLVKKARTELDEEAAKVKYKTDRTLNGSTTYAPTGEQMAMIYDDIIAGKLDATGSFALHNEAVKKANPKS